MFVGHAASLGHASGIPASPSDKEEDDVKIEPAAKEKRQILEAHSYACKVKDGGECNSDPNTSTKHVKKKTKTNEGKETSLSELQENIIRILTEKIDERADQTDMAVKQNTLQIEGIKKSLDSCHQDVAELKKENACLKVQCTEFQGRISEMEQKINDAERYSRHWNLRLYMRNEKSDENIKATVKDISKVFPEAHNTSVIDGVDVVHRIGRLKDARESSTPRPVIIRFISRSERDLVWKLSKANNLLSIKHLRFKEDLTAADKEACKKLWPLVEKARKEGKRAHFVGNKAYVDNKEVRVS